MLEAIAPYIPVTIGAVLTAIILMLERLGK